MTLVEDQNTKLQTEIESVNAQLTSYERKNSYQYEMYSNLKILNTVLVFFYLFLFTLIHVLFLEQYLRGVERSEFWDSVWLTVFFCYPYLMYLFEQGVYFLVTYVLSYIYGKTYVYEFNKLLVNPLYYTDAIPSSITNTQPQTIEPPASTEPAPAPTPMEPQIYNSTADLTITNSRGIVSCKIKNDKIEFTNITTAPNGLTFYGRWLSPNIFVCNFEKYFLLYKFDDGNSVNIYGIENKNYSSVSEADAESIINNKTYGNDVVTSTYSGTK